SPPPRQCGDVNLVGLLSIADDLARSLATLKIRVRPPDPKTSLVGPEEARKNAAKEVDRLLGAAVHFRRHAPAAMLGRCVLGADSTGDCSTEGANLQLNVWDDTARRDIVEDGTTGCVAHSVDLGDDVTARIRLGATPDAVVGSVHAVSEGGVLLVGSASGSRLARTHRVPARRSEWSVPGNSFPTWRRDCAASGATACPRSGDGCGRTTGRPRSSARSSSWSAKPSPSGAWSS
ncbi:hypothetical protein ACWDE9_42775, partial [Streptomyces olivaceoviridis]